MISGTFSSSKLAKVVGDILQDNSNYQHSQERRKPDIDVAIFSYQETQQF